MSKITLLKMFFGLICLSMIIVTVITALKSNLLAVLPGMVRDPWTLATFVDFYFNILILWSWVVYKERSAIQSLAWLMAFLALGSIATSGYVLLQLFKLKPEDSLGKVFLRGGRDA